jgi:DNA-binding MarR family transcriptional regulator/N-acetylglutamate synthase-like GNAT family acetyltransferase
MTLVDEVRGFNRFYTQQIGLLAGRLPGSALSLPEARVLYELAQTEGQTAADIVRRLQMDKAQVSRIVARFRSNGLVKSRVSPDHAKRLLLTVTPAGKKTFARMEQATRVQLDAFLSPLGMEGRERLVCAMRQIKGALGRDAAPVEAFVLRGLAPGDIGWIVHRQAALYHLEYGWDWRYEGLACDILAKFVADFDSEREDAWVAERSGGIVGSIFLMKSDDPSIAKLRLLYVEASARGAGVGRGLVDACIGRARELGYSKITLWTNDVLVAARRLYQAAGFVLVEQSAHHSFGHDLVGQTWTLDLA